MDVTKTLKATASGAPTNHIVKPKPRKNATTTVESRSNSKTQKPVLELVYEAIEFVGEGRKGASAQAIRKYVFSKKENGAQRMINTLVNKALMKGIEIGTLKRPHAGPDKKEVSGAMGRFLLNEKTKTHSKKTKPVENNVLNSDTTEKPTKQKKPLNAIARIKEPKTSTPKPNDKIVKLKDATRPRKTQTTKTIDRKDASDTEIVVVKKGRKSLKDYSSDTEVDFVRKKKAVKSREPRKKTEIVKQKDGKSDPSKTVKPSTSKTTESKVEKAKTKTKKTKPAQEK